MNVTYRSHLLPTPDKNVKVKESLYRTNGPTNMVDVHSNGTVTIEMDMCTNTSTFKEYRNTK